MHRSLGWPAFFALVVLSCVGGKDDEEGELECGTQLCPGGMRLVTVETDDACRASCEPIEPCPAWSVPVVTEDCFTCAVVTSDGGSFNITQPLGHAERYDSCEAVPSKDTTISILRYRLDIDISDVDNVHGTAELEWSNEDDEPVCTAIFDLEPADAAAPAADAGIDKIFGFNHLLASGLTEEGCRALDIDLVAAQAELLDHSYFFFGYAERWTDWSGETYDDVVFRYDKQDAYADGAWYPYQQASIWQDALQITAVLGVSYGDYGDTHIPVTGFESWRWISGDVTCEEQMFVIGATALDVGSSEALYDITFARGAGSTGCTSGIWREARGYRGGYLTTKDSSGRVIDWARVDMSDASIESPRWQLDWEASWPDALSSGTLYMEHR
jgi:hypothetical protein